MFKSLAINLSGPICRCNNFNLQWNIHNNDLEILCRSCGVTLNVPGSSIWTDWNITKPSYKDMERPKGSNLILIKKEKD